MEHCLYHPFCYNKVLNKFKRNESTQGIVSNHSGIKLEIIVKNWGGGGAWEAQSVEHLTLDFASVHDLTISKIEPWIRLPTEFGTCLRFSLSQKTKIIKNLKTL